MKSKKLFVCMLFMMILAGGLMACAQKEVGQKNIQSIWGLMTPKQACSSWTVRKQRNLHGR